MTGAAGRPVPVAKPDRVQVRGIRATYWWCTAYPELDGIEATRQALRKDPTIRVLILTVVEDDDSVIAAMRAGARTTS